MTFTQEQTDKIAETLCESIGTDNATSRSIVYGLTLLFEADNRDFDARRFKQRIYPGSDIE